MWNIFGDMQGRVGSIRDAGDLAGAATGVLERLASDADPNMRLTVASTRPPPRQSWPDWSPILMPTCAWPWPSTTTRPAICWPG